LQLKHNRVEQEAKAGIQGAQEEIKEFTKTQTQFEPEFKKKHFYSELGKKLD